MASQIALGLGDAEQKSKNESSGLVAEAHSIQAPDQAIVPEVAPLRDLSTLVSVVVPRPLYQKYTYRILPEMASQLMKGSWVKVPFGRSQVLGVAVGPVLDANAQSKAELDLPKGLSLESLKSVSEVGSVPYALPQDVVDLCFWASEYYIAPLGEILCTASAPLASAEQVFRKKNKHGKQKKKTQDKSSTSPQEESYSPPALTGEQQDAVSMISQLGDLEPKSQEVLPALDNPTQGGKFVGQEIGNPPPPLLVQKNPVILLEGVTGSGKTEVYIELARKALVQGKGVLVLVPEIALTPQLHKRFARRLGLSEDAIGLWHSALSPGKKAQTCQLLLDKKLRILVGARSVVFAPMPGLGLIIVDEEHDPTYKQEDRFRYHGRDLAIMRGRLTGATVVLGSATPSMETHEKVREKKFHVAHLTRRVGSHRLPDLELVDLCTEERVAGIQAPLATKTLKSIEQVLASGQQALIYLNRRGFAAYMLCQECGEVNRCPQCSISLTVHKRRSRLKCHVCSYEEGIGDTCKKCRGMDLMAIGAGTESIEAELPSLLPEARILRLDRDQITSNRKLNQILEDFRKGVGNVLLGTQMLVKGHDFPGVTLVVVVMADALFRWPDFRAPERAYQILKQVAGRAGRGELPGKVLIQAYETDHPVLRTLLGEISEEAFLESERELRQALQYPPFGRLARLRFESTTYEEAARRAKSVGDLLLTHPYFGQCLQILGPSEAFLEKAGGIYRWDLLIKSAQFKDLYQAIHLAKEKCLSQKWDFIVDVDPYGI